MTKLKYILALALLLFPSAGNSNLQGTYQPLLLASSHATCDPFWDNTVLLMSFNGPNGTQGGAGMTDESPAAHGTAFLPLGTNVLYDTSTSTLGYAASTNFPGGGNRISFNDSNDWNLSNRLWTMELWIRPSTSFGFIVGQWSDSVGDLGWIMTVDTHYELDISTTGSDVITQIASGAVFSPSTWYPVAMDFDGTTYRAYVNGVVVATSTTLHNFFNSTQFLDIGAGQLGAFSYIGNMQEIRITEDVARYHGAYTPTTVPFPRFGC